MLSEDCDNIRQEKSLEQKHQLDRLEGDVLADEMQPNNKSLGGGAEHQQFDSHGIERLEQDLHANISHGNHRDISHG